MPHEAVRATLERMIRTLHHRGPDGDGFHVGDGFALAQTRLSVGEPAGIATPHSDKRSAVRLVCDGRVFNAAELRQRLHRLGHRFAARTDSEVLARLYAHYGDSFVEHVNGDFALALWDGQRRRLLLARDRCGARPLFLQRADGRLWFGSEAKALLAGQAATTRLDPLGLVQAFCYWGSVPPSTIFAGIDSLPAGHVLVVERDGSEQLRRYWDWSFPHASELTSAGARARLGCERHAAGELRELLLDAVRVRLQAGAPVGAYLSGGLDSSGLVALMSQLSEAPVRTFSLAFDEAEFDESTEQTSLVDHLGTEHTTVRCDRHAIGKLFPQLVQHAEAPILRTAAAPLMLLSHRARETGCRAVLSGEGADEVFAGYDLFKEAKIRRYWAHQPQSRSRPRLLERLYGYLEASPVANAALARSFFGHGLEQANRPVFAHLPRWATSRRALRFLSPALRTQVGSWDAAAWYEAQLPPTMQAWQPLARDQYVEAHSLLSAYLLPVQGDRAAMAHAIEGRFPYLDHRVIAFASRLPASWKIRGLTEKYLLRQALEGLLPDAIVHRPKQPYRAPDHASFFINGEPLDYVAELLGPQRLRDAGYFDAATVGRLFDKCRRGRAIGFADNQAFVGILSTMLVDHFFVRQGGALT